MISIVLLPSCFSPGSIAVQLQSCDCHGLRVLCAGVALTGAPGCLCSTSHVKYLALLFESLPLIAACLFNAGQGFFLAFYPLFEVFSATVLFTVSISFIAFYSFCTSVSPVGLAFILVIIVFGSKDEYCVCISLSLFSYYTEVIKKWNIIAALHTALVKSYGFGWYN